MQWSISWPCNFIYTLNLNFELEYLGQDPDLRALRERREWLDALEKAKGGVSNRALVGARAEAKAPFRLARLFTFGGLGAGAALGLAVIVGRLIAALKGVQSRPCTSFYMSCTVRGSLLYFVSVSQIISLVTEWVLLFQGVTRSHFWACPHLQQHHSHIIDQLCAPL